MFFSPIRFRINQGLPVVLCGREVLTKCAVGREIVQKSPRMAAMASIATPSVDHFNE